jgi:hypothetical protein
VIPDEVEALQAARMTAALTLGNDIIGLRHAAQRFAMTSELEPAMIAIAAGDSRTAVRALERFDQVLLKLPVERFTARLISRARGTILSAAESLTQHSAWFDTVLHG